MRPFFLLSALILFPLVSGAVSFNHPSLDGLFNEEKLRCNVIVFVENDEEMIEETFTVKSRSHGHGGTAFEFSKGSQNVLAEASGSWLGLVWKQKGKKVAHGLVALNPGAEKHKVFILYHPQNEGEQVSLDCSRIE